MIPPFMEIWQSIVLGVIEGVTEFLPVSSTGHLVVAQQFMGIGTFSKTDKAAADAFAICIQGGAIVAVLGLYWNRVVQLMRGLMGKDSEGLKLVFMILAGFLPAMVIGVLLNDWIKEHLFHNLPICIAWVIGGIGILAVSAWRKRNPAPAGGKELAEMTLKMAVIIGLLQCVAMCPGTSRSLMTICGGLLVGLSVRAAVEFSFLLGVLTLTAATAKDAVDKVKGLDPAYDAMFGGLKLMLHEFGAANLVVGSLAAMISAAISVKWLVSYLQRHGLAVFGYYRIAVGALVAILILIQVFPG